MLAAVAGFCRLRHGRPGCECIGHPGDREIVIDVHRQSVGPPRLPDNRMKTPTFDVVPSGISGIRQMQLPRVAAT